jgi:hypothetical protein
MESGVHVCVTRKASELPQDRREAKPKDREVKRKAKRPTSQFRTESEFTSAALKEVRKIPQVFVWRQNSGQRGGVRFGGEKGAPDLMGIIGRNGLFWACELKQVGEETTPDQDEWHRKAIERGAKVWVAYTLDEVIRPLMEELR